MTFTCPRCLGTNTEQGKDENCDLLWCRDCRDFVVDLVRDTDYIRDFAQVVGTGMLEEFHAVPGPASSGIVHETHDGDHKNK